MNYITEGELTRILGLMKYLNQADHWTDVYENVGVDVKCHDSNGEPLGEIRYSEGGSYAFYAEGVSDE